MDSIRRELDPQKRADALIALRDTITNDYPAIFLYAPNYLYVSLRDLKGIDTTKPLSEPADRYRGAAGWHLRTKRSLK